MWKRATQSDPNFLIFDSYFSFQTFKKSIKIFEKQSWRNSKGNEQWQQQQQQQQQSGKEDYLNREQLWFTPRQRQEGGGQTTLF